MNHKKKSPTITAGSFLLKMLTEEMFTPSLFFHEKKPGLSFMDQMTLFQKMDHFVDQSLPLLPESPPKKNNPAPKKTPAPHIKHHPALFKKSTHL